MLKQGLIVLFSASFAYWIFGQILFFGVFRHVYNHAPKECFQLPGLEDGSEDIQASNNGQAFISSGIKAFGTDDKVGRIYLFDFNSPKVAPVELEIVGEEKYKALNPHGICIWTNPKTGDVYLYVINHTPDGDAVDKFKFNSPKKVLEHVRRIEHQPDFHSINDLIAVGEDQFYFTNDKYFHLNFEMFLNLHWGSIGFYDGKSTKVVEKGLFLPNGIALSKDGKTLYLAHIGNEELRVYQRNADNSLTFLQISWVLAELSQSSFDDIQRCKSWAGAFMEETNAVYLGTLPDNLDVDMETGDVWIGAHPSFYQFFNHVKNMKEHKSPSHVLKIHFPADSSAKPEVVEVYSNDGTQLSGSSVAVKYKKGLLIGSVFTRTVFCQLNNS